MFARKKSTGTTMLRLGLLRLILLLPHRGPTAGGCAGSRQTAGDGGGRGRGGSAADVAAHTPASRRRSGARRDARKRPAWRRSSDLSTCRDSTTSSARTCAISERRYYRSPCSRRSWTGWAPPRGVQMKTSCGTVLAGKGKSKGSPQNSSKSKGKGKQGKRKGMRKGK